MTLNNPAIFVSSVFGGVLGLSALPKIQWVQFGRRFARTLVEFVIRAAQEAREAGAFPLLSVVADTK